jgi:hypothetical protein
MIPFFLKAEIELKKYYFTIVDMDGNIVQEMLSFTVE